MHCYDATPDPKEKRSRFSMLNRACDPQIVKLKLCQVNNYRKFLKRLLEEKAKAE
ncbi:MAG: hypothetical protein R6V58_00175 [Planctomycetota bacterium]